MENQEEQKATTYWQSTSTIVKVGWGLNILAWLFGVSLSAGQTGAIMAIIACLIGVIIGGIKKDWYLAGVSLADIFILYTYVQDLNEIDRIMNM